MSESRELAELISEDDAVIAAVEGLCPKDGFIIIRVTNARSPSAKPGEGRLILQTNMSQEGAMHYLNEIVHNINENVEPMHRDERPTKRNFN